MLSVPPEEAYFAICCNVALQCDEFCNPPSWHYGRLMIPLCYCDSVCELFGDCCSNFQYVESCQRIGTESGASGYGSGDEDVLDVSASGEIHQRHRRSISAKQNLTKSPVDETSSSELPLSAPLMPAGIHQPSREDPSLSSSFNDVLQEDYSSGIGVEQEFAMMQSCITTSYRHSSYYTNLTKNIGAYMISMCPEESPQVSSDVRERCESHNYAADLDALFSDIKDSIWNVLPVTDNTDPTTHYRNLFCAFCHGIPIANMLPWRLVYTEQTNSAFWFEPPDESMVRRCFSNSLNRRPALLKQLKLANTCQNYTDENHTGCLICRNSSISCYRLPPDLTSRPSLAIPFDFRSYASKAVLATTNQFDCPKGFQLSVNGNNCVLIEEMRTVSSPCVLPGVFSSSYSVKILFDIRNDVVTDSQELIIAFGLHMNYSPNQIQNETVDEMILSNRINQSLIIPSADSSVTPSSLYFQVVSIGGSDIGFYMADTRSRMDLFADAMVNQSSVSIHYVEYTQPCGFFFASECTNGKVFGSGDISFMTDNSTILTKVNSTDKTLYGTDHVMSTVTYHMQATQISGNMHSEVIVEEEVILCNGEEILKCPYIPIDKANYFLNTMNGKLQIISTGEIYIPHQFIILPNKTALVCVERDDDNVTWQQLSEVMFFVYIIGTSISLFALLLTFLTYCALSSLRTVPGIATMNFIVASFFAQLGLLIVGQRMERTHDHLCTFFAIALHYLWLASFFWTTALAFDVSRTLGTGMQPGGGGRGRKLFLYSFFSWGAPLLIIFPSLVFHFCDCSHGACCTNVSFSYGNVDACWIRPQMSNLVAFGIPVMVSLIFNIGLFSRTVSGVRSSKRATKMIERRRVSVVQRAMNEFTIYIKVGVTTHDRNVSKYFLN